MGFVLKPLLSNCDGSDRDCKKRIQKDWQDYKKILTKLAEATANGQHNPRPPSSNGSHNLLENNFTLLRLS